MKNEYIKCKKCKNIVFIVKKLREIKDGGMWAKLVCNKCGEKLIFPKGIKEVIIRRKNE